MNTPRMIDIPIVEIDPEFQNLIPVLTTDEKEALEASLLKEGCRDALVLWDGKLLDGHSRYEICTRLNIPWKPYSMTFDNRDAAKIWIINNQLARRNLTPMQISDLRGARQEIEQNIQGEHRRIGSSAAKLAVEYGVSERTIYNDAKLHRALSKLPPAEKAEVLAGKSDKTKAEITGGKSKSKDIPKLGPPSDGMQYARIAIMNLERISFDDIELDQAMEEVHDYIHRWEQNK